MASFRFSIAAILFVCVTIGTIYAFSNNEIDIEVEGQTDDRKLHLASARAPPSFNYAYQTANGASSDIIEVNGITQDGTLHDIICGNMYSDLIVDGTTMLTYPPNLLSYHNPMGFVARISKTGSWKWAFMINASAWSSCNAITIDSSDDIYIAGWFGGSASFPASTQISTVNGSSGYVAKLNNGNGNVFWVNYTQSNNPNSYTTFNGIDVDSSKNVYVTGSYYKNTIIAGTSYTDTATIGRVLVAKLNQNGVFLWSNVDTGTSALARYPYSYGVNIKYYPSSNSIYVAGDYRTGDSIFGSTTLTATQAMQFRTFIAILDNTGAWTNAVTTYSGTWMYDRNQVQEMAIVSSHIYITGQYSGTIGLDAVLTPAYTLITPITIKNNNIWHGYIFSYDMSLNPTSASSLGSVVPQDVNGYAHGFVAPNSICKLSGNKIALCGSFYGTMTPSSFVSTDAFPFVLTYDVSTPSSPSYISGIVPSPSPVVAYAHKCYCDGSNNVFGTYSFSGSGTYGADTITSASFDAAVISASF